jgi:penicillin-binding protein 2
MVNLSPYNSDESSFFPVGAAKDCLAGEAPDQGPIFVDDTMADWAGRNVSEDEKNQRLRVSVSLGALRLAIALMVLGLGVVTARAAQIQVAEGDLYRALAEDNRSRIEWMPAERGVMFDRNGEAIVRNAPRFAATLTPADLPRDVLERRQAIGRIADLLSQNPRDIEERLATYSTDSTRAVPVAENISHDQALLVDIMSTTWPAIQLVRGVRREYPFAAEVSSLSHLIGYEGKVSEQDLEGGDYLSTDRIGRAGLEKSYESDLRGVYGRRRIEVDALGSHKTVIAEELGQSGNNLELAIDIGLQAEAEAILQKTLDQLDTNRGSLIALQPETGEVLAMVSLPAYDNNLFARGISTQEYRDLLEDENNPLFPRASGASLPSGSTFKLVVAAAALAENIVTPRTTFLSGGGLALSSWFFPDWKAGGHGLTNLAKAISESVNTYFYIIGGGYEDLEGLGVDRIIEYSKRFGLGARTGIDLPVEGEGFLPSKEWKEETKGERWYVGDTYHLAIGQGDILVTPLQIAVMTAVFANGGQLVEPHLVRAVISDGGERQNIPPVTLEERVVDPEYIHEVREGMRDSVLYGSSRSLSLLPVAVAGKTGTAQWSSTKNTHAWFTSFAPYDQPEIVVTVVVEEGGGGSAVAAPVARDLLDYYFARTRGNNEVTE